MPGLNASRHHLRAVGKCPQPAVQLHLSTARCSAHCNPGKPNALPLSLTACMHSSPMQWAKFVEVVYKRQPSSGSSEEGVEEHVVLFVVGDLWAATKPDTAATDALVKAQVSMCLT